MKYVSVKFDREMRAKEVEGALKSKVPARFYTYMSGFVPATVYILNAYGISRNIVVKISEPYGKVNDIRGRFKVDISFPFAYYLSARSDIVIDNYYSSMFLPDCIATFKQLKFESDVRLNYTKGEMVTANDILSRNIPTKLISNDCIAQFKFSTNKEKTIYHITYDCYYGGINYTFQAAAKIFEATQSVTKCVCNLSNCKVKFAAMEKKTYLLIDFTIPLNKVCNNNNERTAYTHICADKLGAMEKVLKPYLKQAGSDFKIIDIGVSNVDYEELGRTMETLSYSLAFSLPA